MTNTLKWIIFLVALLVMINGAFYTVLADHDGYKGKRWYQKIFDWDDDDDDDHERGKKRRRYQERHQNHKEHHDEDYLSPVNNATYEENCGSCHFAYQPGLLPSGSWNKILSGLEDHFGETVELDSDVKRIIKDYLSVNASERSSSKRARKIMECLGSETPLRITEIPYIQKKHHEISLDILKRESIGSLSNCSACHTTAVSGIYDDDDVVIPK
jgi:hypothetical protein